MKYPGSSLPFAFRFVDFDDDTLPVPSTAEPRSGIISELDSLVRSFHFRSSPKASDRTNKIPSSPWSADSSPGLDDVVRALPALPDGALVDHPKSPADRGFPVRLVVEGMGFVGELRKVHRDGVVVQSETLMPIGRSLTLHLSDAVLGTEYTLPLIVVWSMRAGRPTSGLRLNGIPKRLTFSLPDPSSFGPALTGLYANELK